MAALDGKTFVITGATGGIGLQTAKHIAANGGRLVLVGRERSRGEATLAALKALVPEARVQIHYADLTRFDSVRGLATTLSALPRIDVLINNAGAIFNQREVTPDGLERTFALNHMAYFVLTDLLRDRLIASAPSRIINVASEAHRKAALDFGDLQSARRFDGWAAYCRSKLCNILFTSELARRLEGTGVTANCLHPGFVASRIGDNTTGIFRIGVKVAKALFAISTERGAATSTYLATAPELMDTTGKYFNKCAPATPSAAAQDNAAARQLWSESERIARGGASTSATEN